MKIINLIVLLFINLNVYCQTIFNNIIDDTVNHVNNSIIDLDTGYVFLSGTTNEEQIRCFALTFVDVNGFKQWKKVYSDNQNQLWEGWNNNLKTTGESYGFAGGKVNLDNGYVGVNIYEFNSSFDILNQNTIFYDSVPKRVFYSLKSRDKSWYMTGQIYNFDEEEFQLLLLKADSSGNYLWHKLFGDNVYEYGSHIIELSNGNIITAGNSWVTNINNTRWYVINTDTAGNIIWEKYYGRSGFNNGYVTSMLETPDSCILACGTYPAAGYGAGGDEILPDGCLRKIDMNGDLVWEKRYRNYSCHPDGDGITVNASISSISQLDNNDFVLIGSSYWYYSRHRGFMIRTDSEGNVKWHRYYYAVADNSRWQYFSSFKPTPDKGFIIAGYGNDYSNIGYDPPQQAWLVKTDSLGMDGLCNTEPDELNIDIEIPEIPESICSDDTIQVYVHISGKSAPYTLEFSTGQVIDSIYYPPTFVPVEIGLTDINLQWNNQTYFEETITEATLSNHEWGQCIVKPVSFYTPTTVGEHEIQITLTDAYGESISITKNVNVVQCSTFNEIEQISGISIYPNPVKELLFVEYDFTPSYMEGYELLYKVLGIEASDECNKGKITIYSVNGMILQSIALEKVKGLRTVPLKDYASGIYVINVEDCYGNSNSIKITKE